MYLFPGFDQIGYNDHSGEWEVDLDGDWIPLSEERNNCASLLDDAHKGFAVHFLVTESMLVPRSCFDDVDAPEPPRLCERAVASLYSARKDRLISIYRP